MNSSDRERFEALKAELDDLLSDKLVEVGSAVRAARQLTDAADASTGDDQASGVTAQLLTRLETLVESLR